MELIKILNCPQCRNKLQFKSPYYICSPCDEKFPVLNGVPYIVKKPVAFLWQWQLRLEFFKSTLQHNIIETKTKLEDKNILNETRQRLETLKKAQEHNLKV